MAKRRLGPGREWTWVEVFVISCWCWVLALAATTIAYRCCS